MKALKAKARYWLASWLTTRRKQPGATLPGSSEIRSVTFLKLDRIGDFILSTAALHAMRESIPNARFTLIVRAPSAEIARRQFPSWNVVELPSRESALRNLIAQRGVRDRLSSLEESDVLIDLRGSRDYSDSVIASWIPARFKLGLANVFSDAFAEFKFPGAEWMYDELVVRAAAQPGECADIAGLRTLVARVLGRKVSIRPRLSVEESDRAFVRAVLREKFNIPEDQPFLLVFPGTSSPIRELPAAQFSEVILACSDLPILVGGSSADTRTTEPLVAELSKHRTVHDAAGLFSLRQNVAFIAESRMIVSMETCHVHIAGALDVPAVGILGGGHFGDFAPWGESARFRWVYHRTECYGCQWICPFPQPNCLRDIPSASIAQAIQDVLTASA